ncbi:MAG: hypothetical protein KC621_26710 [Myxococcales bacterium]|nr:hypothetical protein [Myxococcales bacterium]
MIRSALGWLRSTAAYVVGSPITLGLVAIAGLSGAGAGVPAGQKLYDYMWRDPVFCGDCHIHDYANIAWERSVHAQLTTCHDCHRVPIRHYPRNLVMAVFARPQTPEEVPNAHVGAVLCERCHAVEGMEEELTGPMPEELRGAVTKIDQSPLHRVHLDAESRTPERYHGGREPATPPEPHPAGGHGEGEEHAIACLDCHGGKDLEVHTFEASARDCVACHEGITPEDEHGASLSCLDCHGRGFVGSQPEHTMLSDEEVR